MAKSCPLTRPVGARGEAKREQTPGENLILQHSCFFPGEKTVPTLRGGRENCNSAGKIPTAFPLQLGPGPRAFSQITRFSAFQFPKLRFDFGQRFCLLVFARDMHFSLLGLFTGLFAFLAFFSTFSLLLLLLCVDRP